MLFGLCIMLKIFRYWVSGMAWEGFEFCFPRLMKCSKKLVLDYRSYFQYGEFGCTIISHSDNTALLKNVYIIRPSTAGVAVGWLWRSWYWQPQCPGLDPLLCKNRKYSLVTWATRLVKDLASLPKVKLFISYLKFLQTLSRLYVIVACAIMSINSWTIVYIMWYIWLWLC